MDIRKLVDVLNEKRLEIVMGAPFSDAEDAGKELYIALSVAVNIIQRYDTGRICLLVESCEIEWEEAFKRNSKEEPLPFSEGDDDVYNI